MKKKETVDFIFYNVKILENNSEAIVIHNSKIVSHGSIPYIFSNYKSKNEYNAQGNFLIFDEIFTFDANERLPNFTIQNSTSKQNKLVIWAYKNNFVQEKNLDLLDPHWDDH